MKRYFAFLLPLLAACSGPMADYATEATGTDTGSELIPEGTLRLDLHPAPDATEVPLPSQSLIVPPGRYEDLTVDLLASRTLSGHLTAQVTHGWSIGAPSTTEPLVATLLALPDSGRIGGAAASDEAGAFSVSFPAYPGSVPIAIVPADATMAPIRVVDAPVGAAVGDWDQDLPTGIPVYGRVTATFNGAEEPAAGLPLRMTVTAGDTVVTSEVFSTDESGWYVARVDGPGEYTLEVVGGAWDADAERFAPALSVSVLVEDERGVELPIQLGEVKDATTSGRVVDADGEPVSQARLRFTSKALDGGLGSVVVETETDEDGADGDGRFITWLLPGVYDVEVFPPYDPNGVHASPVRLENQRIVDGQSFGSIQLAPATRLAGTVFDANGNAGSDVLVVATEVGFGSNVYYGWTDGSGAFAFDVPDVPLTVTLTPSQTTEGAVTHVDVEDPSVVNSFALDEGVLVYGRVIHGDVVIPNASVEVYDAGTDTLLGRTISDSEGRFSLRVSVPEHTSDTGLDDTGADTTDTGGDTGDTGDTGPDSGDTARDSGDSGTDSGDTAAHDSATDTASP